jgi:hypothetical protein
MARRYGIGNKYDSQLRRCAISGLRFYRSEMVKTGEDEYVYHKYVDKDYRSKAHGKTGRLEGDVWGDHARKSLVLFRPYGTPWAAKAPHGVRYGIFRGGVY